MAMRIAARYASRRLLSSGRSVGEEISAQNVHRKISEQEMPALKAEYEALEAEIEDLKLDTQRIRELLRGIHKYAEQTARTPSLESLIRHSETDPDAFSTRHYVGYGMAVSLAVYLLIGTWKAKSSKAGGVNSEGVKSMSRQESSKAGGVISEGVGGLQKHGV